MTDRPICRRAKVQRLIADGKIDMLPKGPVEGRLSVRPSGNVAVVASMRHLLCQAAESMSEPLVFQFAYASSLNASRVDDPMEMLREIVDASCRNNARSGITGYLIFDGSAFVQILEGDQLSVLATYVRIERDPRHRDVTIIGSQHVAKRRFGSWGMDGYLRSLQQDHIFRDHGFVGQMDWTKLSISAAVELASALQCVHTISRPS